MGNGAVPAIGEQRKVLKEYLEALLRQRVRILNVKELGDERTGGEVKNFGYGTPLRIDYAAGDEEPRRAVLHTMKPGPFGHEHMADRAQVLLWQHRAFNHLPQHVRAIDVGGFRTEGDLVSLRGIDEFCLLTEFATGDSYAQDLEKLRDGGSLTPLDVQRADALCDYLVSIHSSREDNAGLYQRRIRELVGHGECIMGVVDAYPDHPLFPASVLERIEHACVRWRWRLKRMTHRLCQVHGDFHPWNILFASGAEFTVLDRSRGELGDAADDVVSLTLNYLFFSLQRSARLEGALGTLFHRFWNRYLERSGDIQMLEAAAPFCAFRCLVMASPLWYPTLPDVVRARLLALALAVLDGDRFDPARVNEYCGA